VVTTFAELPAGVQAEVRDALRRNERQLGVVFRLLEEGVTSNRELVERSGAANDGVAANLRASVRAIVDGYVPTGPSVALQAGRTIGGLLRDNPSLSDEAKVFLAELRERLDAVGRNDEAVQTEDAQILASSEVLEQSIENQPGVYVYTLPTYYRTPKKTDPDRFLYKIGKTDRFVGDRIREQQRLTGLPEDPWTLRVYRCEGMTPAEMERVFHELLEAAGHARATGQYAGREWFATNLEFLDAIARAQGFEIDRANIPEE
jgi:hypothetical protein